jgi:hypothetical protein
MFEKINCPRLAWHVTILLLKKSAITVLTLWNNELSYIFLKASNFMSRLHHRHAHVHDHIHVHTHSYSLAGIWKWTWTDRDKDVDTDTETYAHKKLRFKLILKSGRTSKSFLSLRLRFKGSQKRHRF